MNRQELLESDISKFLERNRLDEKNVKIRRPPPIDLPTVIFCSICGNRIAKATWDQFKWVWEEYQHVCS